jgi:hypothetical protein
MNLDVLRSSDLFKSRLIRAQKVSKHSCCGLQPRERKCVMSRTLLLVATIVACLPVLGLAQEKKAPLAARVPCCGQSTTMTSDLSPQQRRAAGQKSIQALLLKRNGERQLKAGEHLVIDDPGGLKLKAVVTREGVVGSWRLIDPAGRTIARMSASDVGTGKNHVNKCFDLFIQEVGFCVPAQTKGGYSLGEKWCLQDAWGDLQACIRGEGPWAEYLR